MRISLGSWSFSFGPYAANPVPFEKIVERVSSSGYDGIEICGYPPQVTLDKYHTASARAELRRLLADHGIAISGYSSDLTACNPTAAESREGYLDLFRRTVDLCADIGSPMIRIDTVAAPGSISDRDYRPAFERLTDLWHEAARIAADAGVRVMWEFEPGFVFNKPSEIIALHERVDHDNFRILFDTAHAYMCSVIGARQHGKREIVPEGLLGFAEKLLPRIGHVHLVDSDGTLLEDETSRHMPFGEGFIDFAALAPYLQSLHDVEWWCVDLCFCPDAWDLVDSSLEFVEEMINTKPAA